jgi:N-acetyltransferase
MTPLAAPVLCGNLVKLEPLSMTHVRDLAVAGTEDRRTYEFNQIPHPDEVQRYIAARLEQARDTNGAPLAQIRQLDGQAVGCTGLWDPRCWPGRAEFCAVEIGATWLAASAQRTGINVEAKLLLFEYAFETLGVVRVDLKTDARNARSRRAIEGLGARFEGVLRSWSPSHALGETGLLRDSAMFSVIAEEWPATKARLYERLERHRREAAGSE